jgi:hypothetical protein
VLPASDPAAAVNALNELVKKIAGPNWGESKFFTHERVEDTVLYSWGWPDKMLQIATLLKPSYAALKGMVVIGSNKEFTRQVIRTAEQADGLEQTSTFPEAPHRAEAARDVDGPVAVGRIVCRRRSCGTR